MSDFDFEEYEEESSVNIEEEQNNEPSLKKKIITAIILGVSLIAVALIIQRVYKSSNQPKEQGVDYKPNKQQSTISNNYGWQEFNSSKSNFNEIIQDCSGTFKVIAIKYYLKDRQVKAVLVGLLMENGNIIEFEMSYDKATKITVGDKFSIIYDQLMYEDTTFINNVRY